MKWLKNWTIARNVCKLARLLEGSMHSMDSIFRGSGCRPLALIMWPKNEIRAHLNLHYEGQSHGPVAGQHWHSYHDHGHHIHTQQYRLQFQWHRVNLPRFHLPSFGKCLEHRLTQKVNAETCTFQKANYTANWRMNSRIEKYLALLSLGKISSSVGVREWGLLMPRLRSLGSRQSRNAPLLLLTQTRELTQSVGSLTFARIPCITRESSSFLKGSLRASGTLRGGCTTGGTAASTVIWNSPWKQPTLSKQLSYCSRISFLATGSWLQMGCWTALGLDSLLWLVILKFMVIRFKSVQVGRPKIVGPSASTTWNG